MGLKIIDSFWRYMAYKSMEKVMPYTAPGSFQYDKTVGPSFDPTVENLVERQNGNVSTAIHTITNSYVWLKWMIKEKYITNGKEELVPVEDERLSQLLHNPNPLLSTAEFRTYTGQCALLSGNSFVAIELGADNMPSALWPIQTMRISMILDSLGRPEAYLADKGTKFETRFELDEMIHIRIMNVNDPFYGRSQIVPLLNQLLMDYYGDNWNVNFFKNNAIPGSMFTPKTPLKREQAEMIGESWNAQNKGISKAHRTFINPFPGELHIFESALKDGHFLQLLEMNREKIFSALGIPPSVAGVYRYANYANALIQEKAFIERTTIPFTMTIDDKLTRSLVNKYYDPYYVLETDFSKVPALQEDSQKKATNHAVLVRAGIETINEARADYGKEPVPWGDEPPIMSMPIGANPNDADSENEDDSKEGKIAVVGGRVQILRRKSHAPNTGKKTKSPERLKTWKAFDSNVKPYEIIMLRDLSKFFKDQRNRVISGVNAFTVQGRFMSRLAVVKMGYQGKDDLRDAEQIFNVGLEDQEIVKRFGPLYRRLYSGAGNEAFQKLNIDGAFNAHNPNVISAIVERENKIKNVNDTTYQMIQGILSDAYEEGAGIGEVEKMIRSMFDNMTRSRGLTIARTEMVGGFNSGTFLAFEQAEVPKKEWLSTPDEFIRTYENGGQFDHLIADGETVGVNEHFTMTGGALMHPGDPNGDPGNVINCRCTLIAAY